MGFFAFTNKENVGRIGGLSVDLIRRHECAVCPLNHEPHLVHPKMLPTGADRPLIYVLGEAPGQKEDEAGRQFVGPSGRLLRQYLPDKYMDRIRWNNSIRCRPPRVDGKQTAPTELMLNACRPSIIRDIETTKPKAIFAFGGVALWLIDATGIGLWCGRRIPVRVGDHECWLFPFVHPAAILYEETRFGQRRQAPYKTELETQFAIQMKTALVDMEALPEPVIFDRDALLVDIETVSGAGIDDLERIDDFLGSLESDDYVGFDYETNALRPYNRDAKLLSVAWSGRQRTMAVAIDHREARWSRGDRKCLLGKIGGFLRSRRSRLVVHHLPFELEWTAWMFDRHLLWEPDRWEDTESQAFILDERLGALSLEFLCLQTLGINVKEIDNLDRRNLALAPLQSLLRYNGMDSRCHRLLFERQSQRLRRQGLYQVYEQQRNRAIATTAVQIEGVPIDQDRNHDLLDRYMPRLQALEKAISSHADVGRFEQLTGRKYLPSAPQSARSFAIRILKKSLNDSSASSLEGIDHPVIINTLRWRKLNKIISTYILPVTSGSDKWGIEPSRHLCDDGLIRSVLNTNRTRSNRTSSEDPNMQNWPSRTKLGLEARRQVVAPIGSAVVSFDFAGIQARNVAMESEDRTLVEAFYHNYDIHRDWMERIQRICDRRGEDWIPGGLRATAVDRDLYKKFRHNAKNKFVFPSFFGAQPRSIAANLGISEAAARYAHEQFWDIFPDIRIWQRRTIKAYYETGYVTGLSGFRRHAPVAYTEQINTSIQADEAAIVCDAMVRLCRLDLVPCLEIHDDLTFIWPRREVERRSEIVIQEMLAISFPWINVPLEVERSIGDNWADKKPAGVFNSLDLFGQPRHRTKPP